MVNVCDYAKYNDNPCTAKPTFQVKIRHGDCYRTCDDHLTLSLKIVASAAPLTVEPIFSNWAPITSASRAEEVPV